MIYRLTDKEQSQVNVFYEEIKKLEESNDLNSLYIAKKEFDRWINRIESERFAALKEPLQIFENAKELIGDAILFEYASILAMFFPGIEKAKANSMYHIEKGRTICEDYTDFDTWYTIHKAFLDALKEPIKEPIFYISKSSLKEVIINKAIYDHVKALKGSQFEKELDEFLNNSLDNSLFVCEKRTYRTVSMARERGAITEPPKSLIIPTTSDYQYSMSLYQGKNAYLQPLNSMDNLEFKDGTLFFKSRGAKEVSEAELRDLRTNEGIEDLDLINLRYYYSILFDQFQRSECKVLQDIIVVGAPLLAGCKNPKERDIQAAIEKLKSYHNVTGVIKGIRNGKLKESYYQVLNFEYYDEKTNVVAFSSPYMNYIIQSIYDLSLRRENGKVQVTSSGKPLTLPTHSYLIDESIVKERNKAAAENVIIIVGLIEQAGNNKPHIKASTLIERNVQFSERLKKNKNPRSTLERTFKKTWELLRSKTYLIDAYKDIKLPEPEDPAFMPTMKTLDKVVFSFPHKGKIRKS